MNNNWIIPIIIVLLCTITVVYWRSFKLESYENTDVTLAEEEFYNRVNEKVTRKMESSGKKMTCTDKIKLIDNAILKEAYRLTGTDKDACYSIAKSMCEVVNPAILKGSNKKFPPRNVENTALPMVTRLDCFQMHYDCCLKGASGP